MSMPTISIDENLKTAWPATHVACLCYSVDVCSKNQDLWDFYDKTFAPLLEQKLASTALPDMPNIAQARAAYKAFGIDPGRHRISSEALYRRVRQGKALYQINSLVDANNLVSLETGFSLGSYDVAHIGQKIVLRLGQPGEGYAGIGKSGMILENMPVLADDSGLFGSPTSDSTRAMITDGTRKAITVIYSFSGLEALTDCLDLAKRCFNRYACVGEPLVTVI